MDRMNLNKLIAHTAYAAFGGEPKVREFWDDAHNSSIAILSSVDSPNQGITSYSTIGLSAYEIGFTASSGTPIRVELVGASASHCAYFPNLLATCAFNIINSQFTCYPGVIFRNVVSMYDQSSALAHMLFVPPFVWERPLETIHTEQFELAWLLGVPISSAEYDFVISNSSDALELRLEAAQVDLFDLGRPSVL